MSISDASPPGFAEKLAVLIRVEAVHNPAKMLETLPCQLDALWLEPPDRLQDIGIDPVDVKATPERHHTLFIRRS
jgi:hypothetical protein